MLRRRTHAPTHAPQTGFGTPFGGRTHLPVHCRCIPAAPQEPEQPWIYSASSPEDTVRSATPRAQSDRVRGVLREGREPGGFSLTVTL